MAIWDIFKGKRETQKESNVVLGQLQLGNQVIIGRNKDQPSQQLLYVTTASNTTAGRVVDMSALTRNATIMSCVGIKARSISQCGIRVMAQMPDGSFVDATTDSAVGKRDQAKAKQVLNLLMNPNNFQNSYQFWYQWMMWLDLAGETFTVLWREKQKDATATPIEMYNLDATLVTVRLSDTRYPQYVLSSPSYGFSKDQPLEYYQVMHVQEASWQGSSGFNKAILATELVALDSDIDIYANFIMQNGAKPSGVFYTDQVIPDGKFKEIASRIKETWNAMTGSRNTDPSKAGQGMLLDQGMKYEPIKMLTLQDADAAALKDQTMKRICALFGVPPQMLGVTEGKFNNTQTLLDEFYKTTMYPTVINLEQSLKQSLFKGYPNLCVRFDTKDFLKGAALDQMNFAVQGVKNGIITPNEARTYMNMSTIEGADELTVDGGNLDTMPGQSPQDTGGGGGGQTRKMNIGAT
jgi:HK97 family phage portal protein